MSAKINEVGFKSNVKPHLSFEIMRYSKLIARTLPNPVFAPTRFQFYLVYFVVSGRTKHSVDFAECPVKPGDLIFLAPGRVQQYSPSQGLEMFMLLFTPDFLSLSIDARADDSLRSATVLSPFFAPPVLHLPKSERAEVMTLITQLEGEYARPTDAEQPALLSALLKAFLLRAERLAHVQAPRETHAVPSELVAFREALEQQFEKNRSVKMYSRALGISPRRLNTLTQQGFGRSAKQFIDERVVLELKRLLTYTDHSVKSLSARFGFDEPTNLVKFFRHHTEQTPMQFRARQSSRNPRNQERPF